MAPARSRLLFKLSFLASGFALLAFVLWWLLGEPRAEIAGADQVRVLSYSSFINSWGPGNEIAARFQKETGIHIEYADGGDAGVLLSKLDLFPADLVIGLDGLMLSSASLGREWLPLWPGADSRADKPAIFAPFDWSALGFVYRRGEVDPPRSLEDLLDPRFHGAIALEDPRTSAPGLQFLLWVLEAKGVDDGFEFLRKLKPSVQSVSPSWSSAYGLFQKSVAKLVYSYATSPVYHVVHEHNFSYDVALASSAASVQTEYFGIPAKCERCDHARRFARFLLRPEIQKIIMEKNVMMPVKREVSSGTPFAQVPGDFAADQAKKWELLKHRDELFAKWRELEL